MNWDEEPLPTDTSFALRLLQANLRARGRGGVQGGIRGRGARGGFVGGGLLPTQSFSTAGSGISTEQQQGNFDSVPQRGRGAFTIRGRGRASAFGLRQPLLNR